MNFFSGTFNPFGIFTGSGGLFESISNPSSWWDKFKNGNTNSTNKAIADENLAYQKEYNELMQQNYIDERDYNRALQQQIFDREDTAIERQAASLSNLGINPVGQNMQGLGAGSVVGNPNPSGVAPLHNDYQHQDTGLLNFISPIMSLVNGINNLNTQGLQRDSIREQNDYQRLLNQEKALQNSFLENKLKQEQEGRAQENRSKKATANRQEREDKFQNDYGVTDNTNTYVRLATDTANQANRAKDYVTNEVESGTLNTLADIADEKIYQFGQSLKNGYENDKRRIKNAWSSIKGWFKTQKEKSDRFWSTN